MSHQPTLSVVMPNYNHARFLPESLEAILRQSYEPMELVVLDDGSTDNSVEIIEDFTRRDSRVRLLRNERNMGVEYSVNRLLEVASGEYLYSPSADDRVLPGFFEKSLKLLCEYPQAGLCSTVGRLIGENGDDRGVRAMPVVSNGPRFFSPEEVRQRLVRYGRWIDAGSVIYRRDALIREGGQIAALGSFADTFSNLVIALRYGACYIPEPLHCWRQMRAGHASRTANNVAGLLAIGMLASRLMRGTYRELFPSHYVDEFERHWVYGVSVIAGKRAHAEQEHTLRRAWELVCPVPSFVDRAVWFGLRQGIRAQGIAWRLYSIAKFGTWRWWLLGRLSIIINLKRIVIADRLEI